MGKKSSSSSGQKPKYIYVSIFDTDDGEDTIVVARSSTLKEANATTRANNGYSYILRMNDTDYGTLYIKCPMSCHYSSSSINDYYNDGTYGDDGMPYIELVPRYNYSCNVYEFDITIQST